MKKKTSSASVLFLCCTSAATLLTICHFMTNEATDFSEPTISTSIQSIDQKKLFGRYVEIDLREIEKKHFYCSRTNLAIE